MSATETIIDHTSAKFKNIDKFEEFALTNLELTTESLRHTFTPGLYAREFSCPANNFIVSKIHKTEHIFIVSKGAVSVWDGDGEEQFIEAPYMGITKPGTRRILFVWEDLIWTTFHANPDNEDEYQIEERIIEKHDNELLSDELKKKMIDARKDIETKYLTN